MVKRLDGKEPNIKFTEKKRVTKDHFVFFWIEPEKTFPVTPEYIIEILTEPTPSSHG